MRGSGLGALQGPHAAAAAAAAATACQRLPRPIMREQQSRCLHGRN